MKHQRADKIIIPKELKQPSSREQKQLPSIFLQQVYWLESLEILTLLKRNLQHYQAFYR